MNLKILSLVLGLLGFALVVGGIAMIYVPAALIVAGVALVIYAWLADKAAAQVQAQEGDG